MLEVGGLGSWRSLGCALDLRGFGKCQKRWGRILIKLLRAGVSCRHYLLSTSLSKMSVFNFLLDGCRIFPEACVLTFG
jgi:hypothetical protein